VKHRTPDSHPEFAVPAAVFAPARFDRPVTASRDTAANRRRRRGALALGLFVAFGLIYYSGDQRRAIPAAVGDSLSGSVRASRPAGATIRLATFNIHSGVGSDHRLNLARTAETLQGFDLILLNEVHGPYFWQPSGQADQLAELTGKRWLFAPTEERWWHHRFGNAVLTSADVARWQTISLPGHGRTPRNMVLMAVPHGERTIHVVGTHLDRNDPRDRAEQVQAAIGLFLSLAEPAVLMGDLNTTAEESCLEELLRRGDVHDPLGEVLSDKAPRRIDWLLTRGLKTVNAGIVDSGASDHPLIWAELE
jgi:endonuclease/exonuclease/phosphatase family metal-dependent hydrolase